MLHQLGPPQTNRTLTEARWRLYGWKKPKRLGWCQGTKRNWQVIQASHPLTLLRQNWYSWLADTAWRKNIAESDFRSFQLFIVSYSWLEKQNASFSLNYAYGHLYCFWWATRPMLNSRAYHQPASPKPITIHQTWIRIISRSTISHFEHIVFLLTISAVYFSYKSYKAELRLNGRYNNIVF
jgi:hypothetical protein